VAEFDWGRLLARWSADVLESRLGRSRADLITPEMAARRWLGYPPATEAQLAALEGRLGARLPPSYRAFLATTNGWSVATTFAGLLLPAERVGWLRDRNPELVAIWGPGGVWHAGDDIPDAYYLTYGEGSDPTAVRAQHFQTALQVSDPRYLDGECFLLNPQVVTAGGEWEAWFFAHWLPGARRYRPVSFHNDAGGNLAKGQGAVMTRKQIVSYRDDVYARWRFVLESTSVEDHANVVEILGLKASLADRILEQIRHVQHHVGSMHTQLRCRTGSAPQWVGLV